MNEQIKQLYVCLDKETQTVFFASMIGMKGALAELRSSRHVGIGDTIFLRPVEDGWDGVPIPPEDIMKAPHLIEGNVTRVEGRGLFFLRMLSHEEQDVANRVRTGKISEDKLSIDESGAGLVLSVKLLGRLAFESATRLQSYLSNLPKERELIVLDLTELSYLAKNSVGMFSVALKEAVKHGRHVVLLVKGQGPVDEALNTTKIGTIVEIHTVRDEAVASLLRRMLT